MSAYFQYPSLWQDEVVFVCGETLWSVSVKGEGARRLTGEMKGLKYPVHSPDGTCVAFIAEGELYCIQKQEGIPQRLTYLDTSLTTLGWTEAGILLASPHEHPFNLNLIYTLSPQEPGKGLRPVAVGPCEFISYGPNQGCVLQQGGQRYVSWKRYQGGTAGKLWIDRSGDGNFVPLLSEKTHNLLRPIWIENRIYFLSDYENWGNLYSCTPEGDDIQRHTNHQNFYVHQSSAYGSRIVYSAGGSLYLFDTKSSTDAQKLDIPFSPEALMHLRHPKNPATHLSSYDLSPSGDRLALTTRGRLFQLSPFKGPVSQRGKRDGVRYRLACWMHEKQMFLAVCDEGQEEILECYTGDDDHLNPPTRYTQLDFNLSWGRITEMYPSPKDNAIILVNHRHELIWIHLDTKEAHLVGHSPAGPIEGVDWSPCGQWIVYGSKAHAEGVTLMLYHVPTKNTHTLLPGDFHNFNPVFDLSGKYIYFLSARTFNPHMDALRFNLFFDKPVHPFVILLQKNTLSPFITPLLEAEKDPDSSAGAKESIKSEDGVTRTDIPALGSEKSEKLPESDTQEPAKVACTPTQIDLEAIDQRVLMFPNLPPRDYTRLTVLKNQLLYGVMENEKQALYTYDLSLMEEELLISQADSWTVSLDGKWMTYTEEHKIRTLKAGTKPEEGPDRSFKAGGWLDWKRISLMVSPREEWRHMFREAWRLQKELFWMSSMGEINWDEIYHRYMPCIDRISTFSELLDVIDDMQGELGTSHAYILGRKKPPSQASGLGATCTYDPETNAYRVSCLLQGDPWTPSPLRYPGVNMEEGDLIWAVAGQAVSPQLSPQMLILHQTGNLLPLVVSQKDGSQKRTVYITPCAKKTEKEMRYRTWVEANRRAVREATNGRGGYIHIPDMDTLGFGEFFRSYLQEFNSEGLVVDVRFNGGGNVSALILDYLTRKRLGYDYSRLQGIFPYPAESPKGPMVALINEYAGSDGDIFAHSFGALGLGPLIGKRTWGGVVGIWPRYDLLDGTLTSQPEYSFWFHDVGWRVENYGVDPTIEVSIRPQDYVQGRDPQLERGSAELLTLIEQAQHTQNQNESPPPFPCLKSIPLPESP